MKKSILIAIMGVTTFLQAEKPIKRLYFPDFPLVAAQQAFDIYQSDPGPMEISIGHNVPLDNGFNHRWWSHITRHLTFSSGFNLFRTVTSTSFLVWVGAFVIIKKTYLCVHRVHNLLTVRTIDREDPQEVTDLMHDQYVHYKRYEFLLNTYKKLDKILKHCSMRAYFMHDAETDEMVDQVLDYIAEYEKNQIVTQENDE